jgi:hypothetical protein
MKAKWNEAVQPFVDELLLPLPGVRPGKMFGYPAYYTGRKMFACLYGPGVALKLPPADVDRLLGRTGMTRFNPMGRMTMRGWVMIVRKRPGDLRRLRDLFRASFEYVRAG